jgi:2-polyprenyl-3-methyl-5-hydroxy-6-metoxy-1,4-benzoquinol methylase
LGKIAGIPWDKNVDELSKNQKTFVPCPLCGEYEYSPWAMENGFHAVKCSTCGLIYINPRPPLNAITEAVRTGVHSEEMLNLNVVARRIPSKITHYKKIIAEMFFDILTKNKPIRWLDVGAGYGEIVEAISEIAPVGSHIEGVEPMKVKVGKAISRGLLIREGYLADINGKYEFLSIINVFSHIPDFRSFLQDIKRVMLPKAEILIETGNAADVGVRSHVPGELILPDHLVFAGEQQIRRYLEEGGFELIKIKRLRIDTFGWFIKNTTKFFVGRKVIFRLPYTSPSRSLLFRARLIT